LHDRRWLQRLHGSSRQSRCDALGGVAGAARQASGVPAADGLDLSLGVLAGRRLQFRFQRRFHRGAAARRPCRIQLSAWRPCDGRDSGLVAGCPVCRDLRHRRADLFARSAGHEQLRARGRRRLSQLFHLCARPRRHVGRLPMARPRSQGAERGRHLVAASRRVRPALSRVRSAARRTVMSRLTLSERASEQAFWGVSAVLFAASAAAAVLRCASMSAMGEVPICGGCTMSRGWMRLPGATSLGAAASFLLMWMVMMVAMMLPSLLPMLARYRRAVAGIDELRLAGLTALAGAGYFLVWAGLGIAAFPLGVVLTAIEMHRPMLASAVPFAAGVAALIAGAFQFTAWKAHHLACCRSAPELGRTLPADAGTAWRQGFHFGRHCCLSCAGLTAILMVGGLMDLRAMAAVTAAITIERLAPSGERIARVIGAIAVGAGLFLILR